MVYLNNVEVLRLNRYVLHSFKVFLLLDIANDLLLDDQRYILCLIFNGIIVLDDALNRHLLQSDNFLILGDDSLDRNHLDPFYLIVFNKLFLERHIFNPASAGISSTIAF
jgi:hypothetical protein